MRGFLQSIDDYLDALDAVKQQVADETGHMSVKQLQEYFAGAARRLEKAAGQKLRLRRRSRKVSAAGH